MIRTRLGGLLLLLALAYLAGEAWAVGGWQGRPYSWVGDTISALGVPESVWQGEVLLASTRHAAMNATFVASGVRVLLAGLLLAPFVPRARGLVLSLVAAHGLGVVLVGLAPAAEGGPRGVAHGLGAGLAIVGGAALLVAIVVALAPHHPMLATWSALCAAGAVLGCVLLVTGPIGVGLAERLAVDAVIVWQVVTGAALLLTRAGPTRLPSTA